MKNFSGFWPIFTLLMLLSPNISATDVTAQTADENMMSVSPQIHQILSGGFWKDKKNNVSGFYRAGIVMEGNAESLRAKLFVQWLP